MPMRGRTPPIARPFAGKLYVQLANRARSRIALVSNPQRMTARKLRSLRVARSPTSGRRRQPLGGCSRARAWPTVGRMPAVLTRRDLMAGGARLAAGAALAAPGPAPARGAGPRAAPRAGARSGLDRGRVLGLRRPDRRAPGPPVGRRRPLLPRRRRGRVGHQRRAADDPRGGRAARPSGHRPRRRARAARWRAGCASRRRGASARTRRGPTRCSTSAAGCRACTRPARGWRSRSTPRSPRGWRAPGARATSSASGQRRAAHGRRRAALRARSLLPLPQRPPQPDQLERRGLRARRDDDRRHVAAAPRLLPAHAPLRGRRAPAVAGRPARAARATAARRTSVPVIASTT